MGDFARADHVLHVDHDHKQDLPPNAQADPDESR